MIRKPTRIYRFEPGGQVGSQFVRRGGHHKTFIGLLHHIPSLVGAGVGSESSGRLRRPTACRGIDSISLNLHTSLALQAAE